MSFPYKHVLLIGATAGIGASLANRFIAAGLKVTAVGRRKDRLEAFVKQHGADKASAVPFDITKREEAPQFAREVFTQYPTIDAVFLNAGVERAYDWAHPERVDLKQFNWEVETNYLAPVALVHAFLPYLLSKETPTSFIFTGTNLALVPAPYMSAYSSSKAGLNSFLYCLRDELKETNIKVWEISPPPVQTELHDNFIDAQSGPKLGIPVEEFTEQVWNRLSKGETEIIIGHAGPQENFDKIYENRWAAFNGMSGIMKTMKARLDI